MGGERQVDGLAVLVDGAGEVVPLALDLDLRPVHPPVVVDRAFGLSGRQPPTAA